MSSLISLAEWSTKMVDQFDPPFYWEVDEHPYKFCNKHLARWYEKEYNCWANFIDKNFSSLKNSLKEKSIDQDKDYDLIFLKKIREDYDYVRLFFSGGSDSLTVFNKLIENDIFIDEVILLVLEDINLSCNREISEVALPLVKKHKDKFKKYNILTTSWERMYQQYKDPYGFFTLTTGSSAPPDLGRCFIAARDRKFIPNSCYIKCSDKPQLVFYKNKCYATVPDGSVGGEILIPNQIWFWLDKDNIKSYIKDARIYRDYLTTHHKINENQVHFFKPNSTDYSNSLIRDIPSSSKMFKKSVDKKMDGKYVERLKNSISNDQHRLLISYYNCLDKFFEVFPETEQGGFNEYNNNDKFAWFIDIDTLEVFSQKELIPQGF